MLQMKFHPRFIEAFHSGQKITSLRMLDFKCRYYEETDDQQAVYSHDSKLKHNTYVDSIGGITVHLLSGTTVTQLSDLAGLLERQPYKPGAEIELVTEAVGGEWVPFATAIVADVSVIKGDKIENIDAIHNGFNPDRDPLAELHAFMRDVYHTADPVKEMYWLYVFTNVQTLPQWGGEA
ncbi:hypothetical protein O5M60_003007 [Salmonella enterica]|nr:hypothetical protein [Salmonella enterica]EGM0588824.1 hypothetical protein [Salmonella enterica]EJR6806859.1 hypothetical protein [Salmonella enterica]EKF7981419.1 hypothetical protein [Salmonella enterica]EKG9223539.1 hypothetical protein [Salmonella enterica]